MANSGCLVMVLLGGQCHSRLIYSYSFEPVWAENQPARYPLLCDLDVLMWPPSSASHRDEAAVAKPAYERLSWEPEAGYE